MKPIKSHLYYLCTQRHYGQVCMGADLWSSFVQIMYSSSELILFDSDLELNSSDVFYSIFSFILNRHRGANKGHEQSELALYPLTHMSDQNRISPCNITAISNRQVIRIKENVN